MDLRHCDAVSRGRSSELRHIEEAIGRLCEGTTCKANKAFGHLYVVPKYEVDFFGGEFTREPLTGTLKLDFFCGAGQLWRALLAFSGRRKRENDR